MELLNIAGGVALILLGIQFLRRGLERWLGHGLHAWIERMAQRPLTAVSAGFTFGAVAPSSTTQTLLALQLLNAGRLSAANMLVFLLGANVGITIMLQLIAFRVYQYHAVFIVAGLLAYRFTRSENLRGAGQSVMGLGLIFLAMGLISSAARVLAVEPDFQTVLGVLVNHRLLLVIFAAGMTFTLQSSTATISLALAIAESGMVGLNLVLPVVLGANFGIGLTSLAAGYHTASGRRLAAANILLKVAVIVAALLAFAQIEMLVGGSPGSLARRGANFHTGFNVIVAVLGVALSGPLARLVRRVLKPREPGTDAGVQPKATHLDPEALATPVLALANAARETLRLADEVRGMLQGAWRAHLGKNADLAREVQKHDDRIDDINGAIKNYLSHLSSEGMTPRDATLQFGLLNFSSQLESIADIIDKSLCGSVIKHVNETAQPAAADQEALEHLYRKVLHRMEMAISVLATRERRLARQFLREGAELKEWCIEVQKDHYHRLTGDDPAILAASDRFLDMLNILRRISGQLNTIGHTFVMGGPRAEKNGQ